MDMALLGSSFWSGTSLIFRKLVMLAMAKPAESWGSSLREVNSVCNLFEDQVLILFSHEFIYIDVKGKLVILACERLLLMPFFYQKKNCV